MIWYVTPSSESRRTSFGALLRTYRQRATVTQQELAQRAPRTPRPCPSAPPRRTRRPPAPAVLERPETGAANVGSLALQVLNEEVRPLLAEWHPALLDHESRRPVDVSLAAHERAWERSVELRRALFDLQTNLHGHARHLAAIAGVPNPPGLDERQGPASAAEP